MQQFARRHGIVDCLGEGSGELVRVGCHLADDERGSLDRAAPGAADRGTHHEARKVKWSLGSAAEPTRAVPPRPRRVASATSEGPQVRVQADPPERLGVSPI